MSDRQPPRQVQRKLGDVDADGNWQLGSPAPASATDDKTQTVSVTGHKRRAPTPAAPPFSARDLQARHNAAKEKKKTVKSKPVGQGKQPVPNAEEQPAAAKPNENPATPVQHVPLASIKSESPPDSNGAGTNPIDLTGTVRGTTPIEYKTVGKTAINTVNRLTTTPPPPLIRIGSDKGNQKINL